MTISGLDGYLPNWAGLGWAGLGWAGSGLGLGLGWVPNSPDANYLFILLPADAVVTLLPPLLTRGDTEADHDAARISFNKPE